MKLSSISSFSWHGSTYWCFCWDFPAGWVWCGHLKNMIRPHRVGFWITYPWGYDERITIRLKGIIGSSSISFILYLIDAQIWKIGWKSENRTIRKLTAMKFLRVAICNVFQVPFIMFIISQSDLVQIESIRLRRLFWTVPVVALFKFGDIISDLFCQDLTHYRQYFIFKLCDHRLVRASREAVRFCRSLSFDVIVCESFSVIFNPVYWQFNSLNGNFHFTDFYALWASLL